MAKKSLKKTEPVLGQPLVSIVTPVHNGEAFFADTIKTISDQTYKNWEWIVIDDASDDKTREIVKSAIKKHGDKIKLVELKRNSGAAKARNAGIKIAKGNYLCFIDADDLWKSDKLKKQVKFMQDGGYEFSFTGYEFADAEGKLNGKVVSVPEKISYKQALKNTTIWTSTVMFDMDKLSKDDVLMPIIPSEDTATWWKILKMINYAFGLDEVLAYYRRSSGTLSSNKIVAIKRIWMLYRKYEHLSLSSSLFNFFGYAINATKRRL